jgi:hypothetical protein|tara:strand:+ start:63 stop:263 length:201 start_codon:yes stop_codon:yes gene_type:complete
MAAVRNKGVEWMLNELIHAQLLESGGECENVAKLREMKDRNAPMAEVVRWINDQLEFYNKDNFKSV